MDLLIDKKSFIDVFSRKVYEKIVKESILSEYFKETYSEFINILEKLYDDLQENNYSPLSPFTYVYIHKTEIVARIIPILHPKDEAFYYFICKYLENDIAVNRVENTFGGWRLGSPLREKEKEDIFEIEYGSRSYEPWLWSENWKEFVKISRCFVESGHFIKVIKLDISNFYDSVNLNILESKLMQKIEHKKLWAVPYLLYFLKYWNKKLDNYRPRSVGLPQTEFGDQSRLLANFYLQTYDLKVKAICEDKKAAYVRYADDQLIFLRHENTWQDIMLVINSELNKLGLNLNSSKCKIYEINELSNYYLYKPLSLIDEGKYDESFSLFKDLYLKNRNAVRFDTYLKRIISKKIGLQNFNIRNRSFAKQIILEKDFILYCNDVTLNRIYENLEKSERNDFINLLWGYAKEVTFNSYFYYVLKFFQKNRLINEEIKMQEYIKDNNMFM